MFDKVIVLARDSGRVGRLAFYGTPDEARTFFGKQTMEEIVRSVNRTSEGGEGRADEFVSRFALEPVIADKNHPYYFQGLNLLSLLDEKSEAPEQAIASLEAVLADTSGTPYMKGKAHFRLAGLYFKMEQWEKAHHHYNAKEIENLNDRERQTAGEQSAECLVNTKEYLKAADEYKALYKVEAYEKQRPFYLVRIAETTLLAGRKADAYVIFNKVNTEYPKTESSSRSYFNMGDYEQTKTLNYELAMSYYDSSYIARSICEYGQKARERRTALKRLVSMRSRNEDILQSKDSIPNMKSFFANEFMIAELFLLKLSEADSAVYIDQDKNPDGRVDHHKLRF